MHYSLIVHGVAARVEWPDHSLPVHSHICGVVFAMVIINATALTSYKALINDYIKVILLSAGFRS